MSERPRRVVAPVPSKWNWGLRHAKGISTVAIGALSSAFLAFLSQVLLARHFGPSTYGIFAAGLVAVAVLSAVAGMGVPNVWLRKFGREGALANQWLSPSVRLVGLGSVAALGLVILWGAVIGFDSPTFLVLLCLSPLIILQAFGDLVQVRHQLEERYARLAAWQCGPQTARVLAAGLVVAFALPPQSAALAFLGFGLAGAGVAVAATARIIRSGIQPAGHAHVTDAAIPSAAGVGQVTKESWPFALGALFYLIYYHSDILLLEHLVGTTAAGLYGAAVNVMAAAYLLPAVLYRHYVLPRLHRWAAHDTSRFREVYRTGNRVMAAAGVAALLVLLIIASPLATLLFGPGFADSAKLIGYLALALPVRYVTFNIASFMVTHEQIQRKLKYQGASASLNVGLNILLIPMYGAVGAAVATVITETSVLAAYRAIVKDSIGPPAGATQRGPTDTEHNPAE